MRGAMLPVLRLISEGPGGMACNCVQEPVSLRSYSQHTGSTLRQMCDACAATACSAAWQQPLK